MQNHTTRYWQWLGHLDASKWLRCCRQGWCSCSSSHMCSWDCWEMEALQEFGEFLCITFYLFFIHAHFPSITQWFSGDGMHKSFLMKWCSMKATATTALITNPAAPYATLSSILTSMLWRIHLPCRGWCIVEITSTVIWCVLPAA